MEGQRCVAISEEAETVLRRFLFHTKAGDWFIALFEWATGLALVPLESLTDEPEAQADDGRYLL